MTTIEQWVRDEQVDLWSDFVEARRNAANGIWSMQCEWVALRIVEAARLVGPTPWGQIQWPLVAGLVWRCLYEQAGIEIINPTDAELEQSDQLMRDGAGMFHHSVYVEQFKRTRYALTDWWLKTKGGTV